MSKEEVKLKIAAEEIKEILRKHDIAGSVVLHSPAYGEHFIHLNTSYSCAYMTEDHEIRMYIKKEDFQSIKEFQEKKINTANMLRILMELNGHHFLCFKQMSEAFDTATGAEHS